MKRILLITTLLFAANAYAQPATDHSGHQPAPVKTDAKAKAQNTLADGEVRKVDRDAKKITLRHGPIPSIDMGPMTMVYQVKDPAMLEKVKAGDKVKFDAEKTGANYVITRIEPAK
jgi:Cu/Ag efflux protein CusF